MMMMKGTTSKCQRLIPSRKSNLLVPLVSISLLLLLHPIMVIGDDDNDSSSSSPAAAFSGICPSPQCECILDERGRMEVRCLHGLLVDIPTGRMHLGTEVIRIQGTKEQPNQLTIGRVFGDFKKLEEIHVTLSNVPNIGENSFWGVQSLRILNLTSNNISMIVESNFKGLVNVEKLILSSNAIESFVSASFQHLPKLKSLDLSGNRVSKLVERLFYNLHMLEELDLSRNWVRELHPDVFRDIWRLKVLKCRGCGLKTINPLLYALLPDLRVLDLGWNEFKYLSRDEFGGLVRLEELYMDGNQISAITDETFRSLRLQSLTLRSNRIVRIDRHAFYNATVVRLDLSGNQFEQLERATFTQMKRHLTDFDLSRNPRLKLSNLLIILAELINLERLNVCCNGWEDIPLDLFELQGPSLLHLNLSGNKLNSLIPHQLSHLDKLQSLDLSYNSFKGLDEDVLQIVDRIGLGDLILEGNPFACDLCHVSGLIKWVRTRGYSRHSTCSIRTGRGPGCLRCSSPSNLVNRTLSSLDESELDFCTSGPSPSISLADSPRLGLFLGCALLILVLLILSLLIVVKSRLWHAAHYYTHEAERPEVGTPPVPPPLKHSSDEYSTKDQHQIYFDTAPSYKKSMIATIDEINFVDYPELGPPPSTMMMMGDNSSTLILPPPPRGYR